MVGCFHDEPGDMGDGQADEGHGAAEGCGDGSEDAGGEQYQYAGRLDVEAQVCSVVLAEQYGVEWLDEQHGDEQSNETETTEHWQLGKADVAETAHAPIDIGVDTVGIGEEVAEGNYRRREVADHDADNQNGEDTPDELGDKQQQGDDEHGTGEGCCHDGRIAYELQSGTVGR